MGNTSKESGTEEGGFKRTFKHEEPPVEELVPPDGGWAWLIVLACGIMQFVLPTLSTCFGLVYVRLVSSGYTNSQVAPIPGLLYGLSCLIGPLATSLSRYHSHRRLSVFGICTMAAGVFLSALWDNLSWLYVCFGVVGGLGRGIVNPQGFILGQMYFRRRRVAANALSMLGASLGFMVMPPLVRFLANTYAHQGALLLWSAILLHGLVGAALYQPVEWHLKPNPLANFRLVEARPCQEESHNGTRVNDSDDFGGKEFGNESPDIEDESSCQRHPHEPCPCHRPLASATPEGEAQVFLAEAGGGERVGGGRRVGSVVRTSLRSSLYSSCDVIDQYSSALSLEGGKLKGSNGNVAEKADQMPKQPQSITLCGVRFPRFSDILHFRILLHPIFLIVSISSIANRMVFMNFVTYIPAVGEDLNLSDEAPFLLTIISLADLVAKGAMAVVSDRGWCQRRYFVIAGGVSASAAALTVPQSWNFLSLASCCALYGFSLGVIVSVAPVLLVEYLGLKLLPYTFGLLLFMNGVSSLIIFPLTGVVNDIMDNYTSTYYVLGGLSLLPAILWSLVPLVNQDKIKNPV
ncbi:monocarboxylate transporter 1-like [Penaeus monodon]|uniref:monocarboxylate transporter 1-like n=1 Tax=Penaeus monodon TaxID=6687 RepID=UPI0018A71FE2|nr:monocarboxylate transporter 1-like [Penaeus monodon]